MVEVGVGVVCGRCSYVVVAAVVADVVVVVADEREADAKSELVVVASCW